MEGLIHEDQIHQLKELIRWREGDIKDMRFAIDEIRRFIPVEISNTTFSQAQNLWLSLVARIPLGFVEIDVNYISRAREIEDEIYGEQSQISYPPKCGLGRFSFPNAPVFYGAVPFEENQNFLLTGMMEACKDMTNDNCTRPYFDLCIGRWRVNQPFYVLNFCFDNAHLLKNQKLKGGIEYQLRLLKPHIDSESYSLILDFWTLLSYYATAKNPTENHYFMSAALFATVRNYYLRTKGQKVNGILYPSSMTDNHGLSIALLPEVVDKFLTLQDVVIYRVRRLEDKKSYNAFPYSDIARVKDGKFTFSVLRELTDETALISEAARLGYI